MAERLPVQIRTAFIRQGVFGCLLMILGVFALSFLFSEYRIRSELALQSEESAQRYRENPNRNWFEYPRSVSFVVPNGDAAEELAVLDSLDTTRPQYQAQIRELILHDLGWRFKPMWQAQKVRDGSLMVYTIRNAGQSGRNFYLFVSLVALLTAMTFALVTWQTYITTKRALAPVRALSDVVKSWRPGRLEPTSLLASESLSKANAETGNLWQAIHGLAVRVSDFVRRENQFLRDASHELRTPLTVIRVAVDLLKAQGASDPMMERSLSRIQAATERIQSKLDAMMLLSRESEIQLLNEPFSVRDVAAQQVHAAQNNQDRGDVIVHLHDGESLTLNGSRQALSLILEHLLGNALRFTEDGRVDVEVFADRVTVTDSGTGMSDADMTRAFDPFFKVDPFGGEGQGMGLALVQRLAERAGWSVELKSEPGRGTVASVLFSP